MFCFVAYKVGEIIACFFSDRNYLVEKEAGPCLEKVRGDGGGWSKVGTGRFLKYHEAKPSEHRGPDAGGAGAVVGAHGSSFHLLPCSSRNRKQGREKRGRAAAGGAGSLYNRHQLLLLQWRKGPRQGD